MTDRFSREAKAKTLAGLAEHAHLLPGPLLYGLVEELIPALPPLEKAAAVDTILAAPDREAAALRLVAAEAAASWERHCSTAYRAARPLTAVK